MCQLQRQKSTHDIVVKRYFMNSVYFITHYPLYKCFENVLGYQKMHNDNVFLFIKIYATLWRFMSFRELIFLSWCENKHHENISQFIKRRQFDETRQDFIDEHLGNITICFVSINWGYVVVTGKMALRQKRICTRIQFYR